MQAVHVPQNIEFRPNMIFYAINDARRDSWQLQAALRISPSVFVECHSSCESLFPPEISILHLTILFPCSSSNSTFSRRRQRALSSLIEHHVAIFYAMWSNYIRYSPFPFEDPAYALVIPKAILTWQIYIIAPQASMTLRGMVSPSKCLR